MYLYNIYYIYNIYILYIIYIYIIIIYIYIYIYIYTGFSLLVGWRESARPAKNFLISLLLTKFLFPPEEKSIQPNKTIKTTFLAVVIAPVPFLF